MLFWPPRKAWKSLESGIYKGLLILSGIRHTQALRISSLCFRVCTKALGGIARPHFKLIQKSLENASSHWISEIQSEKFP